VALDADLMVDLGLVPFADAFPDRFVECGIAEQDMVSEAGGLAAGGMLPFVHSFGTFLSGRPREQVVNNASERRKIVYMGALAGLIPAGPGHSHQATHDIAAFGATPGITVIAPSTERQVADAVAFAASEQPDSVYLRLCSLPATVPFAPTPLPPRGTGTVLHRGGDDVIVVAYGPVLLTEAYLAVVEDATLAARATVIDLPWVSAFDDDWVVATFGDAGAVVLIDDHSTVRRDGRTAGREDRGSRAVRQCHLLGVDDMPECGQPAEVLERHELDRLSVRDRCLGTLARGDAAA
jgi:transketolase